MSACCHGLLMVWCWHSQCPCLSTLCILHVCTCKKWWSCRIMCIQGTAIRAVSSPTQGVKAYYWKGGAWYHIKAFDPPLFPHQKKKINTEGIISLKYAGRTSLVPRLHPAFQCWMLKTNIEKSWVEPGDEARENTVRVQECTLGLPL